MVYDNSYSMPLPQLLDLALGNPEKGAVNFNILHALLHVMIQQMELTNTRAEFIDGDVQRIDHLARRYLREPRLKLEEYIVSKGKDIQDDHPGDLSSPQVGFSSNRETVRVTREVDTVKEAVVVVMPFDHEPHGETQVQCLRLEETRVRSALEKGVPESSQRPSSKPLYEGKQLAPSGAVGDTSRRKKPEPSGAARLMARAVAALPGAVQPGAKQPGTTQSAAGQPGAAQPETARACVEQPGISQPRATATAPSSASPYHPVAPYSPLPDPATSYPATPCPPPTIPRPGTIYPPTAFPPPVYEYFPPLQVSTNPDNSCVYEYNLPSHSYPVSGVLPKDLVPGTPEYLTAKEPAGPQAPENKPVEMVRCECDPRFRKDPERHSRAPRSRSAPRKPLTTGAGALVSEGPAAGAPAHHPGERPSTPAAGKGPGASFPAEFVPGTPGYWGVMAKIAEEALPPTARPGGLGPATGSLTPLTGRHETVEWEMLSRLDVVEREIREILEERRMLAADEAYNGLKDELKRIERRLWALEGRLTATDGQLQLLARDQHDEGDVDTRGSKPAGDGFPDVLDARIEANNTILSMRKDIQVLKRNCLENEYLELKECEMNPIDSLCKCLKDMKNIKKCLNILTGGEFAVLEKGIEIELNFVKLRNVEERINILEDKNTYHSRDIQSLIESIDVLKEQSKDMEREISLISEKPRTLGKEGTKFTPNSTQNISELNELYDKIHLIHCDLDVVSNTCAKLMEERDERTKHIQSIETQLDTMMRIKADRDELDEALLNKADNMVVNRKVSHDHFDSALEDLTRGLQDAVQKLTQQELLWQEALNELQHEVGNKLDCQELTPLKEFMNKKLNNLHERLKNLSKVRKQAEAAGTKRKLLKDVSCISCDVEAVMRSELDGNVPMSPPFPPHQNMKPYLTYKLDMIRNERKMSRGKHLINLERALNSGQRSKMIIEEGKQATLTKGDHWCNRYCGGSHTLTTAYKRVITMDEFVSKEVVPDCLQIRTSSKKAFSDPMNSNNLTHREKLGTRNFQGAKKDVLTLPKLKKK